MDCELKQFRLLGDLLMESGAALELCTMNVPGLFLPLACTANLFKNLAAVAASSTRAPIYRTFALQNNLADVTAKGKLFPYYISIQISTPIQSFLIASYHSATYTGCP